MHAPRLLPLAVSLCPAPGRAAHPLSSVYLRRWASLRSRAQTAASSSSSSRVSATTMPKAAKVNPNTPLATMFMEMAVLEQKAGSSGYITSAYKKVAKALEGLKKEVKSTADVRGVTGIGKASIEKIGQFLKTGEIKKLEELREEHGAVCVAAPGATKGKVKPPTKAVRAKIKKAMDEVSSKTVADLKAELRQNVQSMSGNKPDLIRKVGEGRVLGAIPKCNVCYLSRPKYDVETGLYTCTGGYDDDTFVSCTFEGAVEREPWQE